MTKKLLFLLAAALFSLFSYNIIIDSSKEKPSDYVDVDLSWVVPISEDRADSRTECNTVSELMLGHYRSESSPLA